MRADDLGMFDVVKLKDGLWSYDIYGEEIHFRKGKTGCVLELGKEPGTVVVEFKIGRGMRGEDFTAVEVEAKCLSLVAKIGTELFQHGSYSELALPGVHSS